MPEQLLQEKYCGPKNHNPPSCVHSSVTEMKKREQWKVKHISNYYMLGNFIGALHSLFHRILPIILKCKHYCYFKDEETETWMI